MPDEQAIVSATDAAKIIFTAALAAAFTLSVTWIKAHRDDAKAKINAFNDLLVEAADLASEYWLTKHDDPQIALMEAKLIGMQMRVSELANIAQKPFNTLDSEIVQTDLADFLDACTGGNFAVHGRAVDYFRARHAQSLAAGISGRMLRAGDASVTLSAYFLRRFYKW